MAANYSSSTATEGSLNLSTIIFTATSTPNMNESIKFDADAMNEWNEEFRLSLLPINIVLVLYIIIGVFGNSIVMYIYTAKLKVKFEDKFFILVLAAMDIIVCFTGPAFSLARNLFAVNYDHNIMCKIPYFVTRTMATASGMLLFGIAIQRYLKVCRPFGRQMTPFMDKALLVVTVVIGVSIDIPILFFYGSVEVKNLDRNIIGFRCGRVDADITEPYSTIRIYFMFMFACALSTILSVVILYIIIGREIYKQIQQHKVLTNPSYRSQTGSGKSSPMSYSPGQKRAYLSTATNSSYIQNTPEGSPKMSEKRRVNDTVDEAPEGTERRKVSINEIVEIVRSSPPRGNSPKHSPRQSPKPSPKLSDVLRKTRHEQANTKGSVYEQREIIDPMRKEPPSQVSIKEKNAMLRQQSNISVRWQKNKLMAHRFSIMFMAIAFVCTIAYLPGLIVNMFVNMDSSYFWSDTYSNSKRSIFLFLFQMYLSNHVANPFIYTFFDKKFRQEFKNIFRRSSKNIISKCPCRNTLQKDNI